MFKAYLLQPPFRSPVGQIQLLGSRASACSSPQGSSTCKAQARTISVVVPRRCLVLSDSHENPTKHSPAVQGAPDDHLLHGTGRRWAPKVTANCREESWDNDG